MQSPVSLEVDSQSVLLGWSPVTGSLSYELQMSMSTPSEEGGTKEGDGEEVEWKTLSSAIQGTSIRKKNLTEGLVYHFRVRSKLSTGWDDWSSASADIRVLLGTTRQMAAPVLASRDTASVTIQWTAPEDENIEVEGYQLRYRSEHALEWTYVPTLLKNTQVKKKSLEVGVNYYFSILPVISRTDSTTEVPPSEKASVFNTDVSPAPFDVEYSPQSQPFQVMQFPPYMSNLFPSQLLNHSGNKLDTAAALSGKMVAIYFSAHWCGPCRQFTPVLSNVYNAVKAAGKADKFEVVFCSADHSETEFKSYYQSMAPWLAVDYEDDERESFMGTFKVQGIPKLVILAPDGRVVTDSAVSASFSVELVEQWLKQCNL